MLQVEIPVPHIRRGQVPVDGHDGAGAVVAIDRAAAVKRCARRIPGSRVVQEILYGDVSRGNRSSGRVARCINRRASRNAAWTEGIVEGDERLPVHGFVDQTTTAAQHRLALAADVPRKAATRAKVRMIGVVETADLMAHLHHAQGRIKISQQIVGFLRNTAELVANAKIDRQILGGPIVILEKRPVRPVVQLQGWISHLDRRLKWRAPQEVFERARTVGTGVRAHHAAQERDTASGIAVGGVGYLVVVEVSAEFKSVLTGSVRDVIYKLRDRIGPLKLWPLESPQAGEKISAKADARETTCVRSAHAGIQTVRRGRSVEIIRQRGLVQPVVADARLVYPACAGSPNPVAAQHLRTGVDRGEPFLLQFWEVLNVAGVVSKKVGAADAASFIEPVVHFADEVFDVDHVVKSVSNTDALGVVQGESAAVAGYGCA